MFWKNQEALILKVSGKHANRYLNARLTNDFRIPVDSAVQAAALTPQGKCEGLYTCIRIGENEAILVCDGGDKAEILSAFKRYLVADRVDVEDVSDAFEHIHLYAIPAEVNFKNHLDCKSFDFGWMIARKRSESLGIDIIRKRDAQIPWQLHNEVTSETANYLRALQGVYGYPNELRERLYLEAEIPGAISSTKGCYTGQEVVERILSHGKSPKIMFAVSFATQDIKVGDKVSFNQNGVGEVVSVYSVDEQKPVGFITIKNDSAIDRACLEIQGHRITCL